MKKTMLLLILVSMNVPIFAMDEQSGKEKYTLVSKDVEKGEQTPTKQSKSGWWRSSGGHYFKGCIALSVGVSTVLFWWILGNAHVEPNGLPACFIAPVNRSDADCVPNWPSHDWLVIRSQLKAMENYSKSSCVPGCTYRVCMSGGYCGGPVAPLGKGANDCLVCDNGVDWWPELYRALGEYDTFQYAVCANQGSVLGKIRSYFKEKGIVFWDFPTADENMEGLFFPAPYTDVVIDAEAYDQVINDAEVWRTITQGQQDDGVECFGQAFE